MTAWTGTTSSNLRPASLPLTPLRLGQWIKTHAPVEQIREIEALAETVIGDRQQAFQWLSEPNAATDDKAPMDLLGDQSGYDRVKNLLLRIEYGVLT